MSVNNTASVGIITYVSHCIICILGVLSNALLLVAFIKDPLRYFRNSGTHLVMSLSVSDCLWCLLTLASKVSPRISTDVIVRYFIILLASVSFITIASISLDRFWMVASPIRHRILMKGKVVILWIAAIWIINILISLFLFISDVNTTTAVQGVCAYSVIVILSSVMYSSTYYKLKKQSRNMALHNSTHGRAQEMRILKEKRFLKTIIIIACIAFICIVPFFALFLLKYSLLLVNDLQAFMIFYAVSTVIYQINFAVNPLIYILRLPNYRKTFYLLYCKRKTSTR